MKLVKTVRCKLEVDKEGTEALQETMLQFSQACNDALVVALDKQITHPYKLHSKLYYTLRERYKDLTSNYVVRVFPRVVRVVKITAKRKRKPKLFRPKSLPLDKDLFRLIEYLSQFKISVSTVQGRKKFKLLIGNYQAGMLIGQKPTAATISYDNQKHAWYINITLSIPVETPKPRPDGKVVGIDLGIINLATMSEGMRFSGKQARHIRQRFRAKRGSLQSQGTKSSKRVLKRLAKRESRWMIGLNHVISRRIVDSLEQGDTIVLENLTHIRERARQRRKQRADFHSWAFSQLQNFIEYKALEKGIAVEYINPAYTSQTCSRCGALGSRQGLSFSCVCGYRNHADYNASFNLSRLGHASLDGLLSTSPRSNAVIGSCKPCGFAAG